MKVGILGTNFGWFHASIYAKHKSVNGIRIWGRNEKKLSDIAGKLNVETTTNIQDIIDDPSIDLVDICLPTDLHREYVIKALDAGKHVFCETPLCTSMKEAEEILDAEARSGKRLFVDQFTKFIPEYRFVKDAIEDCRYGKLVGLKAWRNTSPVWGKLGVDTIGTSLMIHELDFVTWLLGEPVDIEAKAKAKNDAEAYVEAYMALGNAMVSVSASSMMPIGYPFTTGFIAMFEKAAIQANCIFQNDFPKKNVLEYTEGKVQTINLPLYNPYETTIAHVVECCQSGKPSDVSGKMASIAAKTAIKIQNCIQ